jgi:hypothetical protein
MNEKSQICWDSVKASCFTAGSDEDAFTLLGRCGFQQFDISVVLNNQSGIPNVCCKVV